jgi:hypothetical protein
VHRCRLANKPLKLKDILMPVRRSHISQVDTLAVFGKPVPMAGSGKERKLEVATFSMGFLSDFAVFLFLYTH